MRKENELRVMLYVPKNIKAEYSGGIQVFTFPFVTFTKDAKVRNPSEYSDGFGEYKDLEFRAQANAEDLKPYGYQIHYRGVYSVDLTDCERMLKMLKRCSAAEKKFTVRPATYGQFVQLMCIGLGVDGAVTEGESLNGYSSSYDETIHNTWKPSDIAWLIDTRVGEFLEKNAETMKTSSLRRW